MRFPQHLRILALMLLTPHTALQAQEVGEAPINFDADVRPIFVRHCIACHGPDEQRGGLRLDAYEYAKEGGDTGLTVVGGTLESNYLYERITADEPDYRMPKSAASLTESEIAAIAKWIKHGSRWPSESTDAEPEETTWWEQFDRDWLRPNARQLRPYFAAGLVLLVSFLAINRIRGREPEQRPLWLARLAGIPRSWFLFASIILGMSAWTSFLQTDRAQLTADLETLREQLEVPTDNGPFGSPPIPFRPNHDRRLSGTYYRGNCERGAELFNYGNYQTAVLRVSLSDITGKEVGYDAPVPEDGLAIHLVLDRAPGASSSQFAPHIMDSVSLQSLSRDGTPEWKQVVDELPLKTEIDGERWTAICPIELPTRSTAPRVKSEPLPGIPPEVDGVVYVSMGNTKHYGIAFHIDVAEGRVVPPSEIWMGPLFIPGHVDKPTGGVPHTEWFDLRPMPALGK